MDADIAGAKNWLKQHAVLVLLGLALVASAVLLLSLSSGLTFFLDTWDFLMNRRGFTATAYFEPHNEHIVVIPVAIEQLLLRLFGMTSARPEYVVLTALLLVTAVLVFVYVRRRAGPWPALMAAVLLLFLGPAWQVLLWPSSLVFVGSMLFGVAMLLALDRGDRRSDIAACGFLALSIAFFSLGLAFAVGAAVDVSRDGVATVCAAPTSQPSPYCSTRPGTWHGDTAPKAISLSTTCWSRRASSRKALSLRSTRCSG